MSKTQTLLNQIEKIPGGRLFRVRYMSKVTTDAASKKAGISIMKIVNTTVRTGVRYTAIEGVELSEKTKTAIAEGKESNWEWILPNRVKYNKNTGKMYFVVAPLNKGHHTKSTYILTDGDGKSTIIDKETAMKYTVKSYWKDEEKKPTIFNITLDNVLLIR